MSTRGPGQASPVDNSELYGVAIQRFYNGRAPSTLRLTDSTISFSRDLQAAIPAVEDAGVQALLRDLRARGEARVSTQTLSLPAGAQISKFPIGAEKQPPNPMLRVSPMAFDSVQNRAAVYVEMLCGITCGKGTVFILRRNRRGRWETWSEIAVWRS